MNEYLNELQFIFTDNNSYGFGFLINDELNGLMIIRLAGYDSLKLILLCAVLDYGHIECNEIAYYLTNDNAIKYMVQSH